LSDRADAVFTALADPTRREVVQALANEGSATATELAKAMPVTRQAIVKHLAALADAGLVEPERNGREVRYHLTPAPMTDAVAWLTTVGAEWDDRLARLKKVVER
jgi:DNA-binding transcriptional ArsR family regulator